jgi:ribonucleoside-diphosphate reductase alpha chain
MNDIVEDILQERYYQDGENWRKLCLRVANAVAQGEAGKGYDEDFYHCLYRKEFLPNSPTLMNAGISGTLSACFTIDVNDSMESILNAVKEMALIGKSGGGVGANWSKIRPAGSPVNSTNGVASGAVSFLELVNTMGEVVKQGGKRRMAVMSILNCDHPDIEEFINIKSDPTKLNNMNLSVMINDEFMEKVYQGDTKEKDIWDLIVQAAWTTGEPGILFYDTINKDNVTHIPIESTNPCGEQPLIPYGSCNLISIDVSKVVKDGKFNWKKFDELVGLAVRFADATIDINEYPLEKIKDVALNYRNIGVGVMGFAHALIKMGIVYGSEESYTFAKALASKLYDISDYYSKMLSHQLGVFPMFNTTILTESRRNAYLTSLQPTGTVATIAETSFSIEPLFQIAYNRTVLDETYQVIDPLFKQMIIKAGLNLDKIVELVINEEGNIQNIKEIPENIRKLFVTAHDLTPKQHVEMVACFQKYIDAGVSKTVNLPENATYEDVNDIMQYAFENGLKGVTVFRNGCRKSPITTGKKEEKKETLVISTDYKAPDITFGVTERIAVSCGHFLCNVSGVDGKPLKIINNATTGCCDANLIALQRVVSLALRSGVSINLIIKQLDKVACSACLDSERATSKSCAAGISKVLKLYKKYFMENTKIDVLPVGVNINEKKKMNLITCENCGKEYEHNIKCSICPHCFFSKCG